MVVVKSMVVHSEERRDDGVVSQYCSDGPYDVESSSSTPMSDWFDVVAVIWDTMAAWTISNRTMHFVESFFWDV